MDITLVILSLLLVGTVQTIALIIGIVKDDKLYKRIVFIPAYILVISIIMLFYLTSIFVALITFNKNLLISIKDDFLDWIVNKDYL